MFLFTISITTIGVLLLFINRIYTYWTRHGFPQLPASFPFGNFKNTFLFREHIGLTYQKLYQQMKTNNWAIGGVYTLTRPVLLLTDLDLMRNILTKDFNYFADRDAYHNKNKPLQAHLLNLKGEHWKRMRSKLTPTFTSGKMKMMFNIMAECSIGLTKRLDDEIRDAVDIKEVLACFTTNIIGSCAFGVECEALEKEDSPFRRIGRKIMIQSKWVNLKRSLAVIYPKLYEFFNIATGRKEHAQFILGFVKKTIEYREKNNVARNDFIQMLMGMMKEQENPLTLDEMASQCIVFFGAGFETSSTLMTFTLYELAKAPDLQDKLRNEIEKVLEKHQNKITYESIQDITYLNQVIDESLRLHSPAAHLNRVCVKDYPIPNTDLVIQEGIKVVVPILGIHLDPEVYPEPYKFDPDRFSEEQVAQRHNYAHLPFGEGPRNCIGMRFGLLQAKLGLVTVLRRYKFRVNKKTQEPLVYEPENIILSVRGEVWLNVERV